MPFTPFSVVTFGLAQLLIDIEPGIGMMLDWRVLHGYSHTQLDAVLLAVLAAWLAPGLIDIVVGRWNREVHNYGYPWLIVR